MTDNIGTTFKIFFDPRRGYDRVKVSYLETTQLRKLVGLLIKRGSSFEAQQMSGGKWELVTDKSSLFVADVVQVVGSVTEV